MKTITKNELITLVNAATGATFVSIDMVSEPKMRKTDNPYLGTKKAVTISGAINYDYGNSVNNQLEREGKDRDFTPQKRAWGEHEGNWITHKGMHYLSVKVQATSTPEFIYEGTKIDKKLVEPFLYDANKPHTQENLDKEVVVRDIKLDSIKAIRAFGEEYLVV